MREEKAATKVVRKSRVKAAYAVDSSYNARRSGATREGAGTRLRFVRQIPATRDTGASKRRVRVAAAPRPVTCAPYSISSSVMSPQWCRFMPSVEW